MTAVVHQAHLPTGTACFLDARGEGRALVVRWERGDDPHLDPAQRDVVVLSLWRGAECAGTFRLHRDEVPALIETLGGATTR